MVSHLFWFKDLYKTSEYLNFKLSFYLNSCTTVTNRHKLNALNSTSTYSSQGQKFQIWVSAGLHFLPGILWKVCVCVCARSRVCSFQLPEVAHIPWLMAPSSFKVSYDVSSLTHTASLSL